MAAPEAEPFALACNQIEALLIATTPTHDPAAVYTRLDGPSQAQAGAAGYRSFWFAWERSEVISGRAKYNWKSKHEASLSIRIHLGGKTFKAQPNAIVHEAKQIQAIINGHEGWTYGVETVRAPSSSPAEQAGEDVIVKVQLHIYTQETI